MDVDSECDSAKNREPGEADNLNNNINNNVQSFMTQLPEHNPKFLGLKNNIYDFKTTKEKNQCEKGKIEAKIFNQKSLFLKQTEHLWRSNTRDKIDDKNHKADAYLQSGPLTASKRTLSYATRLPAVRQTSQTDLLRKAIQNELSIVQENEKSNLLSLLNQPIN